MRVLIICFFKMYYFSFLGRRAIFKKQPPQ